MRLRFWVMLYTPGVGSVIVDEAATEAEALAKRAAGNRRLRERDGVPATAPFSFYFLDGPGVVNGGAFDGHRMREYRG